MKLKARNMRSNFPNTLVLIKSGSFYRCYDDDSYIIAYLMDYQIKTTVVNDMAGFPVDSLRKVIDKLETKKINYKVFEFENGIAIVKEENDFGFENRYEEIYYLAEKYVKARDRISVITNELYINIENEKMGELLTKIEKNIEEYFE